MREKVYEEKIQLNGRSYAKRLIKRRSRKKFFQQLISLFLIRDEKNNKMERRNRKGRMREEEKKKERKREREKEGEKKRERIWKSR